MNLFAEVMPLLSAAGLALFVGALLTETMVLVPMWRKRQICPRRAAFRILRREMAQREASWVART
jgi:hypothetical protein